MHFLLDLLVKRKTPNGQTTESNNLPLIELIELGSNQYRVLKVNSNTDISGLERPPSDIS